MWEIAKENEKNYNGYTFKIDKNKTNEENLFDFLSLQAEGKYIGKEKIIDASSSLFNYLKFLKRDLHSDKTKSSDTTLFKIVQSLTDIIENKLENNTKEINLVKSSSMIKLISDAKIKVNPIYDITLIDKIDWEQYKYNLPDKNPVKDKTKENYESLDSTDVSDLIKFKLSDGKHIFTAGDLKEKNFKTESLKNADYTAKELKEAGYNAVDLRALETDLQKKARNNKPLYSAKELMEAGYTDKELKDGGYTFSERYNFADIFTVIGNLFTRIGNLLKKLFSMFPPKESPKDNPVNSVVLINPKNETVVLFGGENELDTGLLISATMQDNIESLVIRNSNTNVIIPADSEVSGEGLERFLLSSPPSHLPLVITSLEEIYEETSQANSNNQLITNDDSEDSNKNADVLNEISGLNRVQLYEYVLNHETTDINKFKELLKLVHHEEDFASFIKDGYQLPLGKSPDFAKSLDEIQAELNINQKKTSFIDTIRGMFKSTGNKIHFEMSDVPTYKGGDNKGNEVKEKNPIHKGNFQIHHVESYAKKELEDQKFEGENPMVKQKNTLNKQ